MEARIFFVWFYPLHHVGHGNVELFRLSLLECTDLTIEIDMMGMLFHFKSI